MKIVVSWAIIIVLLYAAQTSLFTFVDYNGVSVNLMLLLTVSVALVHGYWKGVAMGFVTGLIQDLTMGDFFGCAIFSYMIIGLVAGRLSPRIFKDQFIFPLLGAPIAVVVHFFIMIGFIFFLGYQIDLLYMLQAILLPLIFYQLVFAIPVYKIVFDFDEFSQRHG